jgi:hypothetical protein
LNLIGGAEDAAKPIISVQGGRERPELHAAEALPSTSLRRNDVTSVHPIVEVRFMTSFFVLI